MIFMNLFGLKFNPFPHLDA